MMIPVDGEFSLEHGTDRKILGPRRKGYLPRGEDFNKIFLNFCGAKLRGRIIQNGFFDTKTGVFHVKTPVFVVEVT